MNTEPEESVLATMLSLCTSRSLAQRMITGKCFPCVHVGHWYKDRSEESAFSVYKWVIDTNNDQRKVLSLCTSRSLAQRMIRGKCASLYAIPVYM